VPLGALQLTSSSYERELDEMRQANARARSREREIYNRAMLDREMDRATVEEDQIRSRAAQERSSLLSCFFRSVPDLKRARFG